MLLRGKSWHKAWSFALRPNKDTVYFNDASTPFPQSSSNHDVCSRRGMIERYSKTCFAPTSAINLGLDLADVEDLVRPARLIWSAASRSASVSLRSASFHVVWRREEDMVSFYRPQARWFLGSKLEAGVLRTLQDSLAASYHCAHTSVQLLPGRR
jgi:hypothetical protein